MADRKLVPIKAGDATFYVELLPSVVSAPQAGKKGKKKDAEDNLRGVGSAMIPESAYSGLKAMLGQLSAGLKDAIKESKPDELVIEAKIAFGGKAQPIPFLVSAASDASLTVKVTWKK